MIFVRVSTRVEALIPTQMFNQHPVIKDLLSFPHFLAKSPVDISTILGNAALDEKQLVANAFHYFITGPKAAYGVEVGERIQIIEMNLWEKKRTVWEAQIICEIEVSEGV
jgi:hypothetical protein